MKLKNLCPEDIITLSTSISLLLTEKFNDDDLVIIKNLLCSITNNLSTYQTQKLICDKRKK